MTPSGEVRISQVRWRHLLVETDVPGFHAYDTEITHTIHVFFTFQTVNGHICHEKEREWESELLRILV